MSRPVLRTPLCDALGIEYPIILAGMGAGNEGGAAGPELVAAVSEAGGLGVLGGTGHSLEQFHEAIAAVRRLTKKPFGVDLLLPAVGLGESPLDHKDDRGSARRGAATGGGSLHDDKDARGGGAEERIDPRYWQWVEATIDELGLQRPAPQVAGERAGGGPFTETPYAALERQQRHIDAIIAERPAVFAAGLGSPKRYVPALHRAGITVFGLVGNVKTARRVN